MAYKLLVVTPFNDYRRGDEITDQKTVKQILNPRNSLHAFETNVRRVFIVDEPVDESPSKTDEPENQAVPVEHDSVSASEPEGAKA